AEAGKAIIVISSELPEVMGVADRIYTLSAGRITGEVAIQDATHEHLMELMTKERECSRLMAGTSDLKALLTRNVRSSGIYIAFVFIIVLFTILTGGQLLSPRNLTTLVLQYSYILILAIGMVLIIVAGHIDLSVGSVVALTGAVAAV